MICNIANFAAQGPVRWLVLVLVWAGWCWFFMRGKHCWLAGLGWLKPTSEQAKSTESKHLSGPLHDSDIV